MKHKMAQDTEEIRKVQAKTSSFESMGQLLLQGYCMLAEGCSQCMVPLMRNPEGTEDICVNCGKVSSLNLESPNKREQEVVKSQNQLGAEQDTAELLAARMVQGWKMLSLHCPRCQTPLLEKINKGKYCVSCDMPVRNTTDSAGEDRDGQAKAVERLHLSHGITETLDNNRSHVLDLRRCVVLQILEYMNAISRSLTHGCSENIRESPAMHSSEIIRHLSECTDIVSKLERLSL